MLAEKQKILDSIKDLGSKDFIKIIQSDEYNDLLEYYIVNGLETDLAQYDIITEIEDIYIKGNLMYMNKSCHYTTLTIQVDYAKNYYDEIPTILVKVPNKNSNWLDNIYPEDGVKIEVDFKDYTESMELIAKSITKLDKMVFPLYICPECKSIFRVKHNANLTSIACGNYECEYCKTDGKSINTIEVDTVDKLYETLES